MAHFARPDINGVTVLNHDFGYDQTPIQHKKLYLFAIYTACKKFIILYENYFLESVISERMSTRINIGRIHYFKKFF